MSQDMFYPAYFIDAPEILDCSVTPISGSAGSPIQIVADTGAQMSYALQYTDSTGDWIGIYTGKAGHEVLRTIVGGGVTTIIPLVIAAHNRVSVRSMTTSSITNGKITIVFLGPGYITGPT
jgi:hypothetical protein